MVVNLDSAVVYVHQHGNEFDQARLSVLLGEGEIPSRQLQERFLAGQRSDGGWTPFWATNYSSLDATCFRLSQGAELGIDFGDPAFVLAAGFLRSRQRLDGHWEEEDAVREVAPPWATPGVLAARLYLTANCGWWLANASLHGCFVTTDEAATRSGAYLEQHLAQDGSLPAFLHAHWLAAGLWIRLGHDDLAYRVLNYLATRMSANVPASSLAWLLTTLGRLSITPDHPLGERATTLLISKQRADGSWESEDGPDRDPYATVEALRGLFMWAAI